MSPHIEPHPSERRQHSQSVPIGSASTPDRSFLVHESLPVVSEDDESEDDEVGQSLALTRHGEVPPSDIPRLERHRFHSAILPDPHDRCISVYLPIAYFAEPDRSFPVFYLHDGQNLFDDRTSYVPGNTWRAHTTADRLTDDGEIEPIILVGIANTGLRRMAEYTPTRDLKIGGGEGRSYGRLLVEELKPAIDAAYRTLPGPDTTAVGGSSLGGLITLFLGFEYSDTFGKLAVLSPSIWWNSRSILHFIDTGQTRPDLRIWLDMGTSEGAKHLRDTDQLFRLLKRRGWQEYSNLAYRRVDGGIHNEASWADRFDEVLRFLFPAP